MSPSRVVIAPNWLGDAVLSLPVLRALRAAHPGDRLAVLAPRGPAALYRGSGLADEVLSRERLPKDVLALRGGCYSEAWLLPNSFRAALTAFLAGIPVRVGYATDRRGSLLTVAPAPPPRLTHQLRDYDLLLRRMGIEPDLEPPRLTLPAGAIGRAEEALAGAGLGGPNRPVLLAPGAAFGWTKRWPPERFGRLGRRLAELGWPCGIVIGPGEGDLARRVSDAAMAPLPTLGEELDPIELAAVLARARAAVTNDSGPMHLAAAVGTPVVALFGPTDPGRTGPAGRARVLDRYVFCSPCFLKECPYRHECLEGISVEEVLRALVELAV